MPNCWNGSPTMNQQDIKTSKSSMLALAHLVLPILCSSIWCVIIQSTGNPPCFQPLDFHLSGCNSKLFGHVTFIRFVNPLPPFDLIWSLGLNTFWLISVKVSTDLHILHAKFPTEQIEVRKRSQPGPGGVNSQVASEQNCKANQAKQSQVLFCRVKQQNQIELRKTARHGFQS